MSGPKDTARRSVVRATKDQRRLLFLAYETDKTPSKARLDSLSDQTGLSADWILRWFARQRRSDKKRAAQGCIDLSVKLELLDQNAPPSPPVIQGKRKQGRKKLKKAVKKEQTPEAPQLPMSSPSLRWSSPMLPSSSPPRTPTHIAGHAQARVYGDLLSSPAQLYARAYSPACDSVLGSLGAYASGSSIVKAEDAQEAFWLSSFTCRTFTGDFSMSGNTLHTSNHTPGSTGPIDRDTHTVTRPPAASQLSSTRLSGSATSTPAVRLNPSDDAIDVRPVAHGASSSLPGDLSYLSSVDGGRSVASPAAHPAADDALELMMQELLAVLEAETDVVKIAVLLSQLHRLGLRW